MVKIVIENDQETPTWPKLLQFKRVPAHLTHVTHNTAGFRLQVMFKANKADIVKAPPYMLTSLQLHFLVNYRSCVKFIMEAKCRFTSS